MTDWFEVVVFISTVRYGNPFQFLKVLEHDLGLHHGGRPIMKPGESEEVSSTFIPMGNDRLVDSAT